MTNDKIIQITERTVILRQSNSVQPYSFGMPPSPPRARPAEVRLFWGLTVVSMLLCSLLVLELWQPY